MERISSTNDVLSVVVLGLTEKMIQLFPMPFDLLLLRFLAVLLILHETIAGERTPSLDG